MDFLGDPIKGSEVLYRDIIGMYRFDGLGFPTLGSAFLGGPRILGSMFGSPYFGKLPNQ